MGIQERKKRERAGRRRQILTASKQLFADHGFHKTTMEDIANAAELSPGTIYLYFKSKDELLAEISLGILRYLTDRLQKLCTEGELCAEEKLTGIKDILQDVCTFDSFILVNTLKLQCTETLKRLSPYIRSELQYQVNVLVARFSDIFREGIRSGTFINKPPEMFTGALWAVFSGMILLHEIRESFTATRSDLPQALETALDIFHRGIKNNDPRLDF